MRQFFLAILIFLHHFYKHNSSANATSSSSSSNNENNNIEEIEYLKKPTLKWTTSLCDGTIYGCGLNRGNGIVTSIDGRYLFATTDDGTLSIIKTKNGKVVKKYIPENDDDDNWYTVCQSDVSIFYQKKTNNDGNNQYYWEIEYLLYVVNDINVKDETLEDQSRIIALNMKGKKMWSSTIPGISVGRPIIGKNGKYVFINHNTCNETLGQVTVLDATRDGKTVYTSSDRDGNDVPYGPLTIQYNKTDKTDILFWGESFGRGYGKNETKVRKMVVTDEENDNTSSSSKFEIKNIHNIPRWSTNSGISVSKNSKKLWMVGTEARVYAMYQNGTKYKKIWRTHLDLSLRNSSAPIYNKVTISSNEKYLYTASSSTSFYCMDTETGDVIWKNPEKASSIYLTESKLSPDSTKVYSIMHNDGTVIQQNAYNGAIDWKFNCESITGNPMCQDSVKADFSLSLDGSTGTNTLYYGDIFGRIVALQVASDSTITRNTISPTSTSTSGSLQNDGVITNSPTTLFPTLMPSKIPTRNPTSIPSNVPTYTPSTSPSSNPSSSPSSSPSLSPSLSPSTIPTLSPSSFPSITPTITPTLLPSYTPSDEPSDIPSMIPTIVIPISPFISFMNSASSKDKFIFSVLCIIIALCFTMCCLVVPSYLCKKKKNNSHNDGGGGDKDIGRY